VARRLFGFGIALFLLLELSARVFLFGAAGLDPRRVNSIQINGWIAQPSRHSELC